jgi:hypothetical protein
VDLSPEMDDADERPALWLGDEKEATAPPVAGDVTPPVAAGEAARPLTDALGWDEHPTFAFYSGGWSNLSNTSDIYDRNAVVVGWKKPPGAKNWSHVELTKFFRSNFTGLQTYDLVYNVYNLHSDDSKAFNFHIGLHPGVQEPTMDEAIRQGLFQKVLDDVRELWEARLREGFLSSRPDPNRLIKVLFMCRQGFDICNGGLDI